MTAQAIDAPVLSSTALRSINFFNGRLLTGDDLSSEQDSRLALARRYARATGDGVAYGLEVSATGGSPPGQPVLTVTAGVALSPSGLALELLSGLDLSIARATAAAGTEAGALFADCQPYAPGTYTAGAGVYLLTVGPAQQGDGLAPVNGLGNGGSSCNVATEIQTVKFRLIRLALTADELADTAHLRSHVAYLCFAPEALAGFTADPFGTPLAGYGLIDELRSQLLTTDEVPLAVVGWAADTGITFVDLWSVRRRIIRRAAEGTFAPFAGDRRRAEGEAMFLQFRDAIGDLAAGTAPSQLAASAAFEWLPAAGLLPLQSAGWLDGFNVAAFFTGMTTRGPEYVTAADVDAIMRTSFEYPPIATDGHEVTWVYLVRENSAVAPSGGQTYALFATGHMPYAANARFDLSAWDYSNYALI